jgi:hypothetical protein
MRIALAVAVMVMVVAFGVANAAVDPLRIGVGARPLGMGKAYVAVAEDGDTIFINPAGLGRIDNPKLTSMYTELMGDVRYVVLGGVYPYLPIGALGAGVVSTNVSDIQLYDRLANYLGEADYGNNVVFLSYGLDLNEITPIQNVQVGTSLKYFYQGGTGDVSMESGNGQGMDMDLGVLYTPMPWLSLGYTQSNLLASKIYFPETGVAEAVPSVGKAGIKLGIMGKDGLFKIGSIFGGGYQKLNLAVDFDLPSDDPISGAGHVGLEYYPLKWLALRVGVDQDPAPEGIVSNMTAGVGLRYDGIEFNYAYHPYDGIAENTTHFFSISYVGPEEKEEPAPAPKVEKKAEGIDLKNPEDKTMIREDNIDVNGTVNNYSKDSKVLVNGMKPQVNPNGDFATNLKLDGYGKKLVKVTSTNKNGDVAEAKARILRLISFSDVSGDYWARTSIEHSGTVGLVEGYPDGTFRPERALSRAELATLLVRAKGVTLPTADKSVFPDVSRSHWAARYVAAAEEMGLVKGYPDGTFRPNQKISRAEGIMVLARFEGLTDPERGELIYPPYSDVPLDHWAVGMINSAKDAQFLDYVKGDQLKPREDFPRAEAVYILSKTTYAKKKIDWLLNWDVGFGEGQEELSSNPEIELSSFKDVPESYWAQKPVRELASAGVITGYPDGSFRPEKTLSRAELGTLLVKARGIQLPVLRAAPFYDVPKAHWAALYIQAAVDLGLIQGYPNGQFKPNASVTRAEAITVIDRFDGVDVPLMISQPPFPDVSLDLWATRFISAGKQAGILDYLKGKNFEPERPITRAEAAEMISRTKFGKGAIDNMYQGRTAKESLGGDNGEEMPSAPETKPTSNSGSEFKMEGIEGSPSAPELQPPASDGSAPNSQINEAPKGPTAKYKINYSMDGKKKEDVIVVQ